METVKCGDISWSFPFPQAEEQSREKEEKADHIIRL